MTMESKGFQNPIRGEFPATPRLSGAFRQFRTGRTLVEAWVSGCGAKAQGSFSDVVQRGQQVARAAPARWVLDEHPSFYQGLDITLASITDNDDQIAREPGQLYDDIDVALPLPFLSDRGLVGWRRSTI